MSILTTIFPHLDLLQDEFIKCIGQTLQMVAVSGIVSFILGILVGVILIVTKRDGILQNTIIYVFFDKAIDIVRSIPFIILMIMLIPVSRMIMGTAIGVEGAYVALACGTIPFFARQVESILAEVDQGLVEASQAMGFSPFEIIFYVYLKESIPGITRVSMITLVSLIGLTAMAGAIGAGGLGDFAIRYGYQMKQTDMIWITVIVILLIISIIQVIGSFIIKKTSH